MNTKHEYEYGPEIKVPEGGHIELSSGAIIHIKNSFRIATPKPKREFVVGKWYKDKWEGWRKIIFIEEDGVWFTSPKNENMSFKFTVESTERNIDWSVPPRDEAP